MAINYNYGILQALAPKGMNEQIGEVEQSNLRQSQQQLADQQAQAAAIQNQFAPQMNQLKLRGEQATLESAQAAKLGSLLQSIDAIPDEARRQTMYASMLPVFKKVAPAFELPEQYNSDITGVIAGSTIDPKTRLDAELKREGNAAMADYRTATLDLRGETITAQADAKRMQAQDKADQKNQTQATQYSNAIDTNGLTDLMSAVNNTVDLLNPYTTPGADVPGFGEAAGSLPDWAVSKDGKDLRQAYAGVRNSILKARSGGAVTPSEGDRLLQELGEGTGLPDDQVIKGMANVSGFLKNRIQQLQAGYNPEAVDLYKQRGGNVTADAVRQLKGGSGLKPGQSRIIDFNDLPE